MTPRRQEFADALDEHGERFDVRLSRAQIARLADYFELVERWNARLHLVAPCAPAEFATRHVLESLVALKHLPPDASVLDVGSGAGLPIIPCLVARDDLRAVLIEASAKKSVFLNEALRALGLRDVARVINMRFEETDAPDAQAVTCRALERFTEMLPVLVAWSPPDAMLLLCGGHSLRASIDTLSLPCEETLMPGSERRYLFVVARPQT
ncbi:MAG: rRNA (guanine527-N7)-methyltransferase [Acidobacteriota bacterium]|nr:rRNA (guanine527-N7)-methyltransferase [Acidobacteriota bacterium]